MNQEDRHDKVLAGNYSYEGVPRSRPTEFEPLGCTHYKYPVLSAEEAGRQNTVSADYKTKRFLCSYHHDGADWSVVLDAKDMDDAEARCKKLGYLRLDGELVATFSPQMGWVARLICWLRKR